MKTEAKVILVIIVVCSAYFLLKRMYTKPIETEIPPHLDPKNFKPAEKYIDPEHCPQIKNCNHLQCDGQDYDRVIQFRKDGCRECAWFVSFYFL